MSTPFVHLRLHTEYSMVDGMVRVKPLVKACAGMGMPAVAVTDQNNLFAAVKFFNAAKGAGIKPIFGADVWIENPEAPTKPFRLVLLCRDYTGYRNLTRLVSLGYTDGQHQGVPILEREWLLRVYEDQEKGSVRATEGLIALSGGRLGDVGEALLLGKRDLAAERATEWLRLFGDDFYMELQRSRRPKEEEYLHAAVELAAMMELPVVATNDVHFINREDFEAHEVRVCIHDGRTLDDPHRAHRFSEEQYLKSPEEMAELFSDIPEALENTVEIALRCNVQLSLGTYYLPVAPIPGGLSEEEYFRQASREGLEYRLAKLFDVNAPDFAEKRKPYDERLEIELGVILQMGFPGYFLIVADFIKWAKNNGVPVGPGRGSGAGSLVAYALLITDLDPLEYDLLFERFLNPERVSMPDFDIDFCMEGRDRVIDYVAETYGRRQVSQIITYGSMAAKAVVRDVGRVMGHPYGFVDRISKMIPFEVGMTLTKAMEQEEELANTYRDDEEVHELIDMALKLEGLIRNAGKHAGGVVIAPSDLTNFSPLYCEEGGGSLVTQFDKNDVESVGLVKFDFLGLRTLTIIDWALENIRRTIKTRGGDPERECPDIAMIPLEDKASFDNLKAANTTAVFQLESRGMKELIKRLLPDCFEDIVALVALFRPGPLQSGMVDNFIARKHGREKISYPDAQYQHDSLQPILEPTYGVILYQEQVMQIAQVLAGYSLGGADLLRRAMGKKKPEEMAKQRAGFEQGAVDNGIDGTLAMKIFDLVEKFAGYGFNKSHSAAYALVSYQTLWLKTHYPAEFMAAVLSADMDNTDKVVTLIDECNAMGLRVVPPSVNTSSYMFTVREGGSGRPALPPHTGHPDHSGSGRPALPPHTGHPDHSGSGRPALPPHTGHPDHNGVIVYGLGAIKGVGEGAIEGIVSEAEAGGRFTDIFDFCRRIDLKRANRRVLEALIRAGALDELGVNRATLDHQLGEAIQAAEQHLRNQDAGVMDLFGLPAGGDAPEALPANARETRPEWEEDERLAYEKETLGLYLTGHPIERHLKELAQFTTGRISDVCATVPQPEPASDDDDDDNNRWRRKAPEKKVVLAGLVIGIRTLNTKRGRMAFVTLDDRSGRVEAAVFSDDFERYRNILAKDKVLVVEGGLSVDDYSGGFRLSAEKINDIDQAREVYAKRLVLRLDGRLLEPRPAALLADLLAPYRDGSCPITLDYRNADARAPLHLDEGWRVRPASELLQRLGDWVGSERVQVVY